MLPVEAMLKMLLYAWPNRLTAVCYHRVDDPARPGFDTFRPNSSATPVAFRRQMEYLKRHYNVVRCEDLVQWLRGQCELPPRAAVITFDDGYTDNLVHAYPALRDFGLPATIFLCTDHIGTDEPFYWDVAAYCFAHTAKTSADLPLLGRAAWADMLARDRVEKLWVERAKRLQDDDRHAALQALARVLDVRIPQGAFAGLYMNWDQVRELSAAGIEMGAHTASHPILSAIPLERAQREVVSSKEKIESEIGKAVNIFAYPNGGTEDFSRAIMQILHAAGMELAFTLLPGPTRYRTVRATPLGIRRIRIGRHDTFERFVAKLAGAARLK